MKVRVQLVISLVVTALFAGCSGSSSTAPTTRDLSGKWVGTIIEQAGQGTIQANIAQSGSALAGTWQTTSAGGTNSGSLVGSVNNANVVATLNPSVPTQCPFNVVATVNGNVISGTYAAFTCTVASSGTISITKQ